MFYYIVLTAAYFIEAIAAYIFFSHAFERKYEPTRCLIIGLIFHYFAMLVNVLGGNVVWLNLICYCLINILFCYLCFKAKLVKSILYSIIIMFFCSMWEYAVEIILVSTTDSVMQGYLTDDFMMVTIGIFSKALHFLTILILSRFIKHANMVKIPLSLCIYPLSVLVTLTTLWYVCTIGGVNEKGQFALAIVIFLLFVPMVFLFFVYQRSFEKENELFRIKSEMQKVETEKTYYSIIEKQNEQLKSYADETQNHLEAIRNLNSDPQIEEYIDKMSKSLEAYSKIK